MSDIHEQLRLEPPHGTNLTENLIGARQDCPVCHGSGWYWEMPPMSKDAEKTKCGYCGGTGKLVPYIHIHWGVPIDEEEQERLREEAIQNSEFRINN